jgi:hypothetical protein
LNERLNEEFGRIVWPMSGRALLFGEALLDDNKLNDCDVSRHFQNFSFSGENTEVFRARR